MSIDNVIHFDGAFNWDDIVAGGEHTVCVNDFLKGEDNIKLEKVFDLSFSVEEDVIIMEDKPVIEEKEPEVKTYEGLDEPVDETVVLISKTKDKFSIKKEHAMQIILFKEMLDGNMGLDELEFNIDSVFLKFIAETLEYYSTRKFPVIKAAPIEDKFEQTLKSACKDDDWLVEKFKQFNFGQMMTLIHFLNYLGYQKLFLICCAKFASFITNKTCVELWDMIEPVKHRFEKFPTTRQQMVEIDAKGDEYIQDILSERLEAAIKLYEEHYTREREAREALERESKNQSEVTQE